MGWLTLAVLDLPGGALGTEVRMIASGVGDADAVEVRATAAGGALRPPAPVHLNARRLAGGTIRFGWTRRSRIGWSWLDGSDAPLGEESERYRIEIIPSTGAARIAETPVPEFDYEVVAQAADGAAAATSFTLKVSQLGSIAASLPAATRSFTL